VFFQGRNFVSSLFCALQLKNKKSKIKALFPKKDKFFTVLLGTTLQIRKTVSDIIRGQDGVVDT